MSTQTNLFQISDSTSPEAGLLLGANTAVVLNGGNGGGTPINIQDPGVDLVRKTVCLKVRLSTMGNTRRVSTSQIEADADKDLLRVSKHLVDSAELKAIGRFDGEIRRCLYNICLASTPLALNPSPSNASRFYFRGRARVRRGSVSLRGGLPSQR